MMVPGSEQRSGPVAQAMGLRTILAVGLLALGAGNLAAIHTVLLPRYLASRSLGEKAGPVRTAPRAKQLPLAPAEPTPAAHATLGSPPEPATVPVAPSLAQPSAPEAVARNAIQLLPAPVPAAPSEPHSLLPAATESSPPTAALPARPTAEPAPAAPVVAAPALVGTAKAEALPGTVPNHGRDQAPPMAAPAENKDWPSLLFIRNTAWLSPGARESLASLADRLKDDPSLEVVLAGHTDDLGTPEINRTLSLRRAVRARAWLVEQGIDPSRIEVRGLGSSQPALSGSTREARAQNRRVEITVSERSP